MIGTGELDWRYIFRNTARPLLSAAVAVAVLGAALWTHGSQERQVSDHSSSYRAVRNEFNELIAEQRMVEQYLRRYEHFKTIGFVGHESRLDWIETVRTTAESLSLPRVSYSFEPQLEVTPPVRSSGNVNGLEIRVSHVRLELGLKHEVDLLRFFDALQRQAPGLIKVDECTLSWNSDRDRGIVAANNLSASCAIQLYSVITPELDEEQA